MIKTKSTITVRINTIDRVSRFVAITEKFDSDIVIINGKCKVDGKSALGIMSIDLRNPLDVEIYSDSEEEIRKFGEALEEFKVYRRHEKV